MKTHPSLGPSITALGVIPGLMSLVGGLALLWGSQDAMLMLIHWVGEERALGTQNVIPQPDGGKLLTNPGAMFRWMVLIWAVGASQVIAGGYILWRGVRVLLASSKRY
jgi:hypothetical protein